MRSLKTYLIQLRMSSGHTDASNVDNLVQNGTRKLDEWLGIVEPQGNFTGYLSEIGEI